MKAGRGGRGLFIGEEAEFDPELGLRGVEGQFVEAGEKKVLVLAVLVVLVLCPVRRRVYFRSLVLDRLPTFAHLLLLLRVSLRILAQLSERAPSVHRASTVLILKVHGTLMNASSRHGSLASLPTGGETALLGKC